MFAWRRGASLNTDELNIPLGTHSLNITSWYYSCWQDDDGCTFAVGFDVVGARAC